MIKDTPIASLTEKITVVKDSDELKNLLSSIKAAGLRKTVRIAFVNAHAVNMCYRDVGFLRNLMDCDYVFRDGSGMKLLYRFINKDSGLNLNGTDLIPRIVSIYKGEQVALMGTQNPFLEKAAQKIHEMGALPHILMDGFMRGEKYVETLEKQPVPLVILAMGMPKQEQVASLIAGSSIPGVVVCGGAILDFLGEKVTRAPLLFRKSGMEWLYRLMLEPKRLFKRYMLGNFLFLFRSARYALRVSRARP